MLSSQRMFDGIVNAMQDPALQDLVCEYHRVRDVLVIGDAEDVSQRLVVLLSSLRLLLEDRRALLAVEGRATDGDGLTRGLECIATAEEYVTGSALADCASVLYVLAEQLGNDGNASSDPEVLLGRLDGCLALLGLGDVSVAALWRTSAADSQSLCDALWVAVQGLLTSIRRHCHLATG
jgi:hypothetical protein